MLSVSREGHEKNEFFQAIQVWVPRFRLFGTFILGSENSGKSAFFIHQDLLPEGVIVIHVIACQGHDHVVNVQPGRRNFVVVNVHFEPELALRRLRERLRLITPQWPPYPGAVGIIMGDFKICEPEEGRFNVWNQSVTDGDTEKGALFHSLLPHVLETAQPDYSRRDSSVIGIIRTLSRIDRIFINLPVAEARDFHCYPHVFEIQENQSIPSDHAAVRFVMKNRLIGDNWANAFQVGCRNIPFPVCSILQRLDDDHRYSADPFWRARRFQNHPRKGQKADCSRTLTQDT